MSLALLGRMRIQLEVVAAWLRHFDYLQCEVRFGGIDVFFIGQPLRHIRVSGVNVFGGLYTHFVDSGLRTLADVRHNRVRAILDRALANFQGRILGLRLQDDVPELDRCPVLEADLTLNRVQLRAGWTTTNSERQS